MLLEFRRVLFRSVQAAKDKGTAVDATCGKKTRAVIEMDSEHLVLSALLPETIANRVNSKDEMDQKGEEDE